MSNFDIQFKLDSTQLEKLSKISIFVRQAVIDKAMPAMARPIMEKAKDIAPRSDTAQSGNATQGPTRDKWGKNKTKHFDPTTWAKDNSSEHMGYRTYKNPDGAGIKVGAKSPKGNKQRFNQGKNHERRVVYWGKPQGFTYRPKERFMQRAYDETIPQQLTAFENALRRAMETLR
jgi:hypothetical protein